MQVILHERFRPHIRVIKAILVIVGLLSAFITFKSVFVAFLFGLGIYLLSTFFERFAFSYNSFYVHALPDFKIKQTKWRGAFFGYAEQAGKPHQIPMVGWIFSEENYARRVHSLLLRWSYGTYRDQERNVCASVVVNDNQSYVFLCYPNPERETAREFYKAVEKERRQSSLTDVHQRMFLTLVFCKTCDITKNSYFPEFRRRYRDGIPYIFRVALENTGGMPQEISGLKDFIFFNLKIKNRSDLDQKDLEFNFLKIFGK